TYVSKVRLNWESAFARDYELLVSDDGTHWTTRVAVKDGKGGVEEKELGVTARYLRLLGLRRSTPWGISLWEFEALDASGQPISRGKAATASSVEDDNPFVLWLKFWPLILIAIGFPLVVAPRDDVSQVFGMIFTAVGGYLQLQGLGYVSWGLRQSMSVVL